MSVEAGEAGTGGAPSFADWIVPQFRVVTTGDRRRGVRLERVFWKLLDDIAARRGLKRSSLIAEVLENAAEGTESVASTLRCYAATTIDIERNTLLARINPQQMIALMQQAPVPAFAINRQKKLQQVNAEFMQLLRPTLNAGGPGAARNVADFVHLSLDTPIDELFHAARSAPSTQCNYTLQVDDRRRRGQAKIVLVPDDRLETLVGYVLP